MRSSQLDFHFREGQMLPRDQVGGERLLREQVVGEMLPSEEDMEGRS